MRFHISTAFVPTEQLLPLCRPAEEYGWHGFYLSDHIFYPRDLKSPYTYTPDGAPIWTPDDDWPDSWCLISAMAATAQRLEFTTGVYIAPARDLVTVAKQVGTTAVISGGRVNLGVGAGWCEEEFVATGQDFATRGKRLDEMIPALRALWSGGWVEYHGAFYDLPPMTMNPPPAKMVPILAGGLTDVAMRRAARLCDGWISGPVHSLDDAWRELGRMRAFLDRAGRSPDDFRIFMAVPAKPSPDLFADLAGAGLTDLVTAPWMVLPGGSYSSDLDFKRRACQVVGEELRSCV